ncbi:MAG: hypothetical protein ABL962_09625 [Fimbriimonadaceae bacterium]
MLRSDGGGEIVAQGTPEDAAKLMRPAGPKPAGRRPKLYGAVSQADSGAQESARQGEEQENRGGGVNRAIIENFIA